MTVLIDTSAWIEFFRAAGSPAIKSQVADALAQDEAAYTCPVRFELFIGARRSELDALREGLSYARRIPASPGHWDAAAEHGAKLRAKGATVPASDLLIATIAAAEKLPLVACDKHFELIRKKVLPNLTLL
jgi:predicted nucleic acid-binding protein